MKKIIAVLLCCLLSFSFIACNKTQIPVSELYLDSSLSIEERINDLIGQMTIAEKAGQMVQGEQSAASFNDMSSLGLGSILSGGGSVPNRDNSVENWTETINRYQTAALSRKLKIPFLYGVDAVHGHNTLRNAVIFPHNIGIGAANDLGLTEQMGAYIAEEMKLTGILFNFSPCVAVAQDIRWGRTYESYSSDPDIVSDLAESYLKGQQSEGVLATAKHYAGDGGAEFGTGRNNLIDRGNVTIDEQQFRDLHLAPYERMIKNNIKCIMVSFSSYNGIKMHQNKYLVTDVLKDEFGFQGFVISDWEGISEINASSFNEQIIVSVNAGIDMLMEPYRFKDAIDAIIAGVKNGDISQERINDAVTRILRVKFEMGLFEDPYLDEPNISINELGASTGRAIAKQLVEKSQVLLKNSNNVLPLKSGQKVYVIGPASNDIGVQCGGWSITWQGLAGNNLTTGTSILEGINDIASEYNLEIITDKNRANEADVVLLAVGEIPYAEYEGDTTNPSIIGNKALIGNNAAILEANNLNKPIITVIVAGRNVLINDYINDWDAVVMSYLPGTEGSGIVSVLTGETKFTGKLSMPWYKSTSDINSVNPDLQFDLGYGIQT